MSYGTRGGHGYGGQRRSGSGTHGFGKQKSHTISAKLDLQRQEARKPVIMEIPDQQAYNLIVDDVFTNADLFRDYPLGSYAVYVDRYSHDSGPRKKPIYQVIKITGMSPFGRAGTVTPYGHIVSSHQAFNAEDNEKFKERAIAEATDRNKAFFKDVANKKARIRGITEKKEQEIAEKNKGQATLF